MKIKLDKKQSIAIAAIVLATVVLGTLILGISQSSTKEDDERAEVAKTAGKSGSAADGNQKKTNGQAENHGQAAKPAVEEGKIELTEAQIKAAGVTIQTAAAGRVKSLMTLPGEIHFNEDKTTRVVPRFAGVVERVPANIGQQVKKGQVLAVIASAGLSDLRSELLTAQKRLALATTTHDREKKLWEEKISAEQDYLQAQQAMREAQIAAQNAQQKLNALGANSGSAGALNRYEIRAPFDGMLIEKRVALGDAVKEDANLFTISDLSTVWAEITVPASDLNLVRVGEKVTVKTTAMDIRANGVVSYVSALVGDQSRTAKARVTLANPNMAWRPGLFVNIDVTANEMEVPVAVSTDAVQEINGKPVVFVRTQQGFIAQLVSIGRSGSGLIEITDGMKAGTPYAAKGSFVLKAELGKSSAKDND